MTEEILLKRVSELFQTKSLLKKLSKVFPHFPCEDLSNAKSINYSANSVTIEHENGFIIKTNDNCEICLFSDIELNRKPRSLFEIKKGKKSCFILNNISFETYVNRLEKKAIEILKCFQIGLIKKKCIKDITNEFNSKERAKYRVAYSLNIKPYELASFSYIKTRENGNINIKLANCHIIAINDNDKICVFSGYDEEYNSVLNIDKFVHQFNKENNLHIYNFLRVLRNYRPSICDRYAIVKKSKIEYHTIMKIDEKRKYTEKEINYLIDAYSIKTTEGICLADYKFYNGPLLYID